jgi:hypothetical protein
LFTIHFKVRIIELFWLVNFCNIIQSERSLHILSEMIWFIDRPILLALYYPLANEVARGYIVTLPSVCHNPCEHSRINILQWILTKLGTYLVLTRIWNPVDFQGQSHRVKYLPHNILVNTLESTSFNGVWLNLIHT